MRIVAAGKSAPALDDLLTAAPGMLRDLLRNVFNLSLAAQPLGHIDSMPVPQAFGRLYSEPRLVRVPEAA